MHAVVAFALVAALTLLAGTVQAQDEKSTPKPVMDNTRLGALIEKLDPRAAGQPGYWKLTLRGRALLVIIDESADRMRILAGVTKAEEVSPELLYRLMQANFDTALDARYAIAQDVLWTAFLHPLASLKEGLFLSGLAQVVILAETFGTQFTSGAMTFGGGDSGDLLRELEERANAI